LVAPYKDQRDRFKSQNSVIEIYVHTSEIRGRESFHVTEYEAPTENFIDIDTTTDNETDSYYKLLKNITL
jgi:adenylylsulfate kinase-like enzyme